MEEGDRSPTNNENKLRVLVAVVKCIEPTSPARLRSRAIAAPEAVVREEGRVDLLGERHAKCCRRRD